MKALMKAKPMKRFYDGGEVEAMGSGDAPSTSSEDSSPAPERKQSFKEAFASAKQGSTFEWNGKKFKKEYADSKSSAPVAGRPRGEGGPVSTTRQMADRSAADAQNARAASERRAAAAREAASETARESRRSVSDGTAPKRKVLSTAGVDSKTLMPQKYANGGHVTARQTTKSHGKAC